MSEASNVAFPDILQWLRSEILTALTVWKGEHAVADYWKTPLVGVARADDPLFGRLREVVDPEHAMPQDLLSGARSVIVFFLPFHQWVGEENNKAGGFAARSWAECYVTTNRLIAAINDHLKNRFEEMGHEAAITPATHNFDEKKLVSRWSHKHLAYIAGLGTFGHHHLLITEMGCCGRLGSLVTSMTIPATARSGVERCLTKAGRRCLACVSKCKYGALHETHFDRHACYAQCLRNDARYDDLPLVDVCGKCGCGVPCSYGDPVANLDSQQTD